jgi:hypothetical protein
MRWVERVARVGDRRGACRFLVERPNGNAQLGKFRWEDNIKTNLQKVGCRIMDWIIMA